jgi:hypothetical protein
MGTHGLSGYNARRPPDILADRQQPTFPRKFDDHMHVGAKRRYVEHDTGQDIVFGVFNRLPAGTIHEFDVLRPDA